MFVCVHTWQMACSPTLQTRSDYMLGVPQLLQTTNYLFMQLPDNPVATLGVVKAPPIHTKDPAQHVRDLKVASQDPVC